MPRAYDKHPSQRTSADHNPLANLLNWQDATTQSAQSAGAAINNGITVGSQQAAAAASNTTLTSILTALGLTAGEVDNIDSTVQTFTSWLLTLLTPNSSLNASNLWGLLPSGVSLSVGATSVTAVPVQPLWNPDFESVISLMPASGWLWDSTVYYAANTAPGSAEVTANGTVFGLRSNPIPVSGGQTLAPTAQVLTAGLVSTGSPIELDFVTFLGNTQVAVVPVQAMGAATGSASTWTNPPSGAKAGALTGSFTVPNDGTVDNVHVRLGVGSLATAGVVRFGAVQVSISGGLIANIQSDLTSLGDDATASVAAFSTFWQAAGTAITAYLTTFNFPTLATALETAWTAYMTTESNLASGEWATIHQLLSSLGINTGTGLTSPTRIGNVLGAPTLGDDVQAILDFVANGLGHSGTGHSLAQIESYFGIIPPANVAAILGGANLGADVSAVHSTVGTNTSWLTQISEIVSGTAVTPINSSVSDFKTWWAAITGAGASGTVAATAIAGTLPGSQVSGAQGITDVVTSFTSSWNQFAISMGWNPAGGDAALATLAGLFQGTAQNAATGVSLGQSNANVLGQVNNVSSFEGLDTTSEANMPLANVASFSGSNQNASAIGFVRCKKAGVKNAISFRAGNSNATHFYVNAFRFDLATGNLIYLWSSADLLASVPASNGWVYYPFGSNSITVAAGDILAFELQPVATVTGGVPNSVSVAGSSLAITDSHPNAKQKNQGATRAAGTTPPTGNITAANYTWRGTAPYLSLEITSLPVNYQPPVTTEYTTPGPTTWTMPAWMVAGNLIDLVVVGGGGGGGFVNSGAPGAWGARTLVVGTDIAVGATLTPSPGAGGVYPSSSSTVSVVALSGTNLVSGAGGANYANSGGSSTSPGNETFNGRPYFGGTNVGLKQNGSAPGGAGSYSGDANAFYDTAGAAGAVWITARQS